MLRIAVCDDEEQTSIYLKKLTEETISSHVKIFSSRRELLKSNEEFQIFLLNIGIGEFNGIETAKRIRKHSDALIIFITSLREPVFEAFDVEAFHYLLKPVNERKLKEVLRKAEGKCLGRKSEEPLIIRKNGTCCNIAKDDILYAENDGRKVILHMEERQIEYYARMKELEEELGSQFFRIHRGYLVNLRAVKSYHVGGVILKNREEILMAKTKYQDFVTAYIKFWRRYKGGI
ncbi:MAG: response regulator transcription factor [Lachnospiraceae bacterium]|nr:response regulator transcription factor [Lachnospiraceae bacterium]